MVAADIDEERQAASPSALVETLALDKALAVAAQQPAGADDAVLGADTVVALGTRILGKPADAEEAREMLGALRGRTHEVSTGVALVLGDTREVRSVTTEVRMRGYSDAEIDAYVARTAREDGPYDKAGAYALQDVTFAPVAESRGCVCSVIGLPLWTVHTALAGAGFAVSPPPLERCSGCPFATS